MPAFHKVKKGKQVTKCTQEVIDIICNTLRVGAYTETAVVMAGVSKETYRRWMILAQKKPNSIYAALRAAVLKAQEEATVRDLVNIDKAAMGEEPVYMRDKDGSIVFSENGKPIVLKPGSKRDWNASAWRLSRRKPKDWAPIQKMEHSGPEGGPIENTTVEETPEQKAERNELTRQLLDGLRNG